MSAEYPLYSYATEHNRNCIRYSLFIYTTEHIRYIGIPQRTLLLQNIFGMTGLVDALVWEDAASYHKIVQGA